jgi:hypothetical protein
LRRSCEVSMAKTKDTEAQKAAALVVKEAPRAPPTPLEVFHRNLVLVDKYSETRDTLQLSRVWRYMGHLRAHLAAAHLKAAIDTYVGDKAHLLALLAAAVAARTPAGEVRVWGLAVAAVCPCLCPPPTCASASA